MDTAMFDIIRELTHYFRMGVLMLLNAQKLDMKSILFV